MNKLCYLTLALTALSAGPAKLAQAQTQVPQAETSAGPAVTTLNGTTYVAWAGYHKQPENLGFHVAYTTLGADQTVFDNVYTTVAPALATADGRAYLAIRGNKPFPQADSIYYSSTTTTKFPAPTTRIPGASTTAAPALTGDSSTLFAAWTTSSGAIEYASYAGSWSSPHSTPGVTHAAMAPALAVYNSALYLAWVRSGGTQLEFATLPLNGDSWSAAQLVENGGAQTNLPPSLAVFNATLSTDAGFYLSWVDAGQINYAKFEVASGLWVPGPIPPGPLATSFSPALLSKSISCAPGLLGSIYEFQLFYSEADSDMYYKPLLTAGKCHAPIICKGTTCQ